MIIKEKNDLQQLIHILQQQFPNEKNVPLKDTLDAMLSLNGQLNMLVDVGMLDGKVFLNFIKAMLVLQGLVESHTGIGEMTVTQAYDRVIDEGYELDFIEKPESRSLFESLSKDLAPVSDRELIGMMAAQNLGLKGGPADD